MVYGPAKPHLGQRYSLPKSRHFSQRQMVTPPQLGHGNFTDLSSGEIFVPQEMHDGMWLSLLRCPICHI